MADHVPLLSVERASCHFEGPGGRFAAVDGVSLEIAAGEVVGLVGESGSGKSTLGRLITGLNQCSSGSIRFAGRALPTRYRAADFRYYADKIQMVFQDAYGSLNPRSRVSEALAEPLLLQGLRPREAQLRASQWLERVGLSAQMGARFPHELSGGQRQRVGVARAFINRPQLVICDEPVSALDVSVQAQIINLLRDLQREEGVAMLFIAHDLAVVRYLADRTLVMYRGKIMESGDSGAVFTQPRHPYTQTLLAANPVADPQLERQRRGSVPAAAGIIAREGEGCCFAPRCFQAQPRCVSEEPLLEVQGENRRCACHFPLGL